MPIHDQSYSNQPSAKFRPIDENRNSIKAWIIIVALYVVLFVVLSISLTPNGNEYVYITQTGDCYHKMGCSSLNHSNSKITLEQAANLGYRPCNNCHPPRLITNEHEGSPSFGLILSLLPSSFVLSILVWMYSIFMFHLFRIPEDQIHLRWYPISSFLFLTCLYLSMHFPQ